MIDYFYSFWNIVALINRNEVKETQLPYFPFKDNGIKTSTYMTLPSRSGSLWCSAVQTALAMNSDGSTEK